MKHTLFLTMLAAALLGGQVFAETYSVKDNWSDGGLALIASLEATLRVDAQKTFAVIVSNSPSLTLDYQGEEFVLTASNYIKPSNDGVLNITSTVDSVAAKWEETFSVAEGGSITLCSAGEVNKSGSVQFFGKEADNTVKLGNTEVMFVGEVASKDALAMNQVGVVWGNKDMLLVGKIGSSPVPEPTTGSLSLLALAGLCARRRRK